MGGHMSKKTPAMSSYMDLNTDIETELKSYEDACKLDSDLLSFDSTLQDRTNRVINTLAVGVDVRSLSFDSVKQVTGCLLDMNQEVVKVILDCKKDIWQSKELFEVVEEYFDNSLQTLDFCNALEKCLKRARDSQLPIHLALQQFEKETASSGDNRYARTLHELKNFKAVGDPFTEEFFQLYQSVYNQQILMLRKLQLRKKKLDKKLKHIHTWRKVSSIIFVATVTTVLICSVVAAAIASPHIAAALAAVTTIPVGSLGKWIDSLMKTYEDALKGHKDVTIAMEVGSFVAIKDLDHIRILVNRLADEIESLRRKVDFAIEEKDAVKVAIEQIKKMLDLFTKNVEDLGVQADTCSRDILQARTVVLKRIIKLQDN